MALSLVQQGASPSGSAFGTPIQVLASNAALGDCVALCLYNTPGAPLVTSPMGIFEYVGSETNIFTVSWYVCLEVTGPGNTITVGGSGSGWDGQAFEWAGGVASVAFGGGATGGAGGTISLTMSGLVADQALLVCLGTTGSITASPTSPWTNTSLLASVLTTAYQVTTSSSNQTASWTIASGLGTYEVAGLILSHAAPLVPSLQSPPNASYQDVSSGQPLSGIYNAALGDSMGAYACRIKTSAGTYSYYNAGTNALQSTIVWNADSVAPGASFGPTLPNTAISDGFTYNWSMACQDATYGGQGPFATDYTFTAQAVPTVTVTAPTGTVSTTTQPTVTWTAIFPGLAQPVTYNVIVESGTYGAEPGSGTQAWTSGVVTSSLNSAQIGVPLLSGTTYRAFVQVGETGGQVSAWGHSTFTLSVDTPATPVVTAAPSTDPDSGYPVIVIEVQGLDNYLSAVDASFETGVGTAVPANCTIAESTAEALDGTHSLAMTAVNNGAMTVTLGPYPVTAGEKVVAFAAFRAATHGRTCTTGVSWYGDLGSSTSSGTPDTTSAWTQSEAQTNPAAGLIATATAPAGATEYSVVCTVLSAVSGETHYLDCVAAKPAVMASEIEDLNGGSARSTPTAFVTGGAADSTPTEFIVGGDAFTPEVPVWSRGGLVGLTTTVVTRSDNQYVRWASAANPLAIPSVGQLAVVYDYEAVPLDDYTYAATVQVASIPLSSDPASSEAPVSLITTGWWELNPAAGTATTNPTATNAQMVAWTPVQTEQATANQVLSVPFMSIVTNAMMNQDFAGTAETFSDAIYAAFNALLIGQATLFISSPWGALDSGYFRVGPQSGGMSSGLGTTAKSTTLMPSVAGQGHRTTAVTAVAQPRPAV